MILSTGFLEVFASGFREYYYEDVYLVFQVTFSYEIFHFG